MSKQTSGFMNKLMTSMLDMVTPSFCFWWSIGLMVGSAFSKSTPIAAASLAWFLAAAVLRKLEQIK